MRPAAKIGAGDAGWESQIILDSGGGACLTTGCFRLDDERFQTFGGSVDCGCEAGRTGSDDNDVVEVLRGLGNLTRSNAKRVSRDSRDLRAARG